MSKELSPLEALERIRSHNYHEHSKKKCLEVIETALKNYEHSQNQRELYFKQAKELKSRELGNQKKLKAFEIIKEKRVDCFLLTCIFLNKDEVGIYNDLNGITRDRLTQEEYDLLKEVLL